MKIYNAALKTLSTEIKSATGSMTSVPKPLKYLREFYPGLKAFYERNSSLDKKFMVALSDVMSVLAMTMAAEGSREMLTYKLVGNRKELGVWGHEYVRALCGEISQEFNTEKADKKSLKELARNIVPFLIEQSTETEAVDLLYEIEDLQFLLETDYVDKGNCERTCLYLTKFAEYVGDVAALKQVLVTTFELYLRCEDLPNALRVALMLDDSDKVTQVFSQKYGDTEEDHNSMRKQLGLILGTQRFFSYQDEDETVNDYISNENLSKHYVEHLAHCIHKDQEPKSPEDVYKTSLYEDNEAQVQSATYNFAATYVNAFVNCGLTYDALMEKKGVDNNDHQWLDNNKENGKLAAVASLGLVSLWNPDVGSGSISRYLDTEQNDIHKYAGGLLGMGICETGINSAANIAVNLVVPAVEDTEDPRNSEVVVKICSSLGLAIACVGNPVEGSEEAVKLMQDYLKNDELEASVRFFAALSIGLVYVGTANSEIASEIIETLFEFDETSLKHPSAKFAILGWALIYLGMQDEQRVTMQEQLEAVSAMENVQLAKFAVVLFDCCAYAGSGNVIQVQKMLQLCAETLTEEGLTFEEHEANAEDEPAAGGDEDDEGADPAAEKPEVDKEVVAANSIRQSMAVLGVALITFSDPVGRQMADRTFQHLLQYGDLAIRRAVPLAMALIRVSDPEYGQVDVLSKLTHDSDIPTAMSAIMALGIMSAGTTNARVSQLLRQLAAFYKDDETVLQVVRISQGLLFTGNGLVTMHPFHSDRTLMSKTGVASLLVVLVSSLDMKNTILGQYHYLLYTLAAAIRPRMCMTLVDNGKGELEPVSVNVRIGQAVETVGLAGNPKKITGFQTKETPVILNVGDRVELATDEYESFSSVMEGIVVLKKIESKEETV